MMKRRTEVRCSLKAAPRKAKAEAYPTNTGSSGLGHASEVGASATPPRSLPPLRSPVLTCFSSSPLLCVSAVNSKFFQQVIRDMQIPVVPGPQLHARLDHAMEVRPTGHQHSVLLRESQIQLHVFRIVIAMVCLN